MRAKFNANLTEDLAFHYCFPLVLGCRSLMGEDLRCAVNGKT